MVKVFSEWDIGLGNNFCLEGTVEEAKLEVKEIFEDFEDELGLSFKEACNENLITFDD